MPERNVLFDLMPAPLRWIVNAVPIIVAVALLVLAAGLFTDAQDPRGIVGWMQSQGISLHAFGAVTLVFALILILFRRQVRFYSVRGALLYGVLTLPYPIYCGLAAYYVLFVNPTASRTAAIAFGIGYVCCFILFFKASMIALWMNAVEVRRH